MLPSTLTAGSVNFDAQQTQNNKSLYSDSSVAVSNQARLLTIAHETTKAGRTNTALFIDNERINVDLGTSFGNIRVQAKISYDPTTGNPDLETDINDGIAQIIALLSDTSLIPKLLNKELA